MPFSKKQQADEELEHLIERRREISAAIDELTTRVSVLETAVVEQLHFVASLFERGAINATQKDELEHQAKARVAEQLAEIKIRRLTLLAELNTQGAALRSMLETERSKLEAAQRTRKRLNLLGSALQIAKIAMKVFGSSGDTKS